MPSETHDPLLSEYLPSIAGLTIVRQPPPPGAATAAITYLTPAGTGVDPAGREGLAEVTARVALSAAGPFDRRALARALDRKGASVQCEVAPESTEVTITGPAEEWSSLAHLLALVVTEPRFEEEDLARVVRQAVEQRWRETTQPSYRARRELFRAVFPRGHPYRATGTVTSASRGRLTRRAVAAFHRRHYAGEGAMLVFTVPARAGPIARAVRREFRTLEGRSAPRPPPLPSLDVRPTERTVEMAGRSQTEVWMGGSSIRRADPIFPAAALACDALGGRPVINRLFQRLREEAGLAYHAASDLEAMRWGGYWLAHAGTNPKSARTVVDLLRREVARLGAERIRIGELRTIRESAIGEMALALETTAEAHELAVDLAYHRLPGRFWKDWPAQLRDVPPARVTEAARQALDGASASLVLCGSVAGRR